MRKFMTVYQEQDLTHSIIGAAIAVHKELGPGLLESIYEECLVYELNNNGIYVDRQVQCPLKQVGLLMNFNVCTLRNGIQRFAL